MKRILLLLITVITAQYGSSQATNNSISLDFSRGFFGTGDYNGVSISFEYQRHLSTRLTAQLGYVTANSSATTRPYDNDETLAEVQGITVYGDRPVSSISRYAGWIGGIGYQVVKRENQFVKIDVGAEYRLYQEIRFGGFTRFQNEINLLPPIYFNQNELAPYVRINYTYMLSDHFGIGAQIRGHFGNNILYAYGLSATARF